MTDSVPVGAVKPSAAVRSLAMSSASATRTMTTARRGPTGGQAQATHAAMNAASAPIPYTPIHGASLASGLSTCA